MAKCPSAINDSLGREQDAPESTRMLEGLFHLDRAMDAVLLEIQGWAASFCSTQ